MITLMIMSLIQWCTIKNIYFHNSMKVKLWVVIIIIILNGSAFY